MKKSIFRIAIIFLGVVLCLPVFPNGAGAQEILLDKMEKCGDLICYPGMKEPNQFYYLPDQPALAYKNGKPQFSFLKYARTGETGKAGIGQAQGGGIVHFLVTYGVTENRIRAAERNLQERHPDARLVGPIVYRSGNFALITSFKEGNEITTKTVAVGKAPLMEGQKTAVSMALTREGAELLWESFQSDTPDISLVFDMEFAGIRQPYEATLEADWNQVSKHNRIKAGFQYKWFGADVDMLFQELRQTGAIKITTKGENTTMDSILQSANEKLLKVMFDPVPADDLTRAAAESGYDSLNQAAKLLRDAAGGSGSGSASPSGSGTRSPGASRSGGVNRDHVRNASTVFPAVAEAISGLSLFSPLFTAAYADLPGAIASSSAGETTGGEPSARDEQLAPATRRFEDGVRLYRAGQYREAILAFEESEEIHRQVTGNPSSNGAVPNNIGMCHLELGNYQLARNYFEDAARRYPEGSQGQDTARRGLEDARRMIDQGQAQGAATTATAPPSSEVMPQEILAESSSDAYNRARRLDEEARNAGYPADITRLAVAAYEGYQRDHTPTGSRADEVMGRIRMLRERLSAAEALASQTSRDAGPGSGQQVSDNPFSDILGTSLPSTPPSPTGTSTTGTPTTDRPQPAATSTTTGAGTAATGNASSGSTPSATAQPSSGARTSAATTSPGTTAARQTRAAGSPGFSLVASYQMKQIKRSGKMVYDMNHFRTETQAFAMAENIGDIYKRFGNDAKIFRAVTIDDPVFKQREILVTLDGQDAATFTRYLNFVTVKMKKKHQKGDVTTGEIVITPEIFNASGNNFSMTYGWKNDDNRTAWLNYEYQAIWSFHGGVEIRTPWTQTDSPMLALTPPHRYRAISIEGDGNALTLAQVRHGVVTLSCRVGDQYIKQQVTVRNSGPAPSMVVDVPEDGKNPDTRVAVTWHLTQNRQLSSPETKLEGDIIYWDEMPKGGV